MTTAIEILATDLENARRARPDLTEGELVALALRRGTELTRPHAGSEDDTARDDLRVDLAEAIIEAVALRRSIVTNRDRFSDAHDRELQTYEEHLDLQRNVVPPLKREARRLRYELKRLEAEATARGIDLSSVEPEIDWSNTIAVDDYTPTTFASNADRRAAVVEFFRRPGDR